MGKHLTPELLEQITKNQLASWEQNRGTFPLPSRPNSLAQFAGSCQQRSFRSRLFFFKGSK